MLWLLIGLLLAGGQADSPQTLAGRLWEQYARKVVQHDADGVADLFTADARLMEAGVDDVVGRAAIRAYLKSVFAGRTRVLDDRILPREVLAYDGVMFDRGDYVETIGAPTEPRHATDLYGRYFAVWSQEPDGTWKIARLLVGLKKQPAR